MFKLSGVATAAFLLASTAAFAAPLRAVVFDFEVVDPTPGVNQISAERIKAASDQLRALLVKSGQITIVDVTPQKDAIAKNLPLNKCNGCDLDIAKALGADVEVTPAIQRTSNVITSISAWIKDVKTGRTIRAGLVDIRGNAEDEWTHGVKFLVKDRLLDPPLPDEAALRETVDKAAAK